MSTFVTKIIEAIKGRQKFEQLVILPDEFIHSKLDMKDIDGIWDEYQDDLEEKYAGSFQGLVRIMNKVANLQIVPSTKFKEITPSKEIVAEYEFKYQDLRVYAIKIPYGKLIVLGGYKNQQAGDIRKFRALKKKYLEYLKNHVNEKDY